MAIVGRAPFAPVEDHSVNRKPKPTGSVSMGQPGALRRDEITFGSRPMQPAGPPQAPQNGRPPQKKPLSLGQKIMIGAALFLGINWVGGALTSRPADPIPMQDQACVLMVDAPEGEFRLTPPQAAEREAVDAELTAKATQPATYANHGSLICVDEALALINGGYVEQSEEIQDPNKVVTPHYQFRLSNGVVVLLEKPQDVAENQRLRRAIQENGIPHEIVTTPEGSLLGSLVGMMLPILLLIGFWMFIMKRMGAGGMGGLGALKGQAAKEADAEKPNQKLSDVRGYPEVVEELQDVVNAFNNYRVALEKYQQDPSKHKLPRPPKGILLSGPPGTGKTLMARAVAGEVSVPFYAMSGSEFVEMFVGLGAARVRELFKKARETAPCIVFIDEIDALGENRNRSGNISGGNDERVQTLNQLLKEMDGFRQEKLPILLMAATNFPERLDPALTRSGRLEKEIGVGYPKDWTQQRDLLDVHLRGKQMARDVDLDQIAKMAASGGPKGTPAFVGADHKQLVEEAERQADKDNRGVITQKHLVNAWERILLGLAVPKLGNRAEKEVVASHEHGHGLMTLASPSGKDKVFVVSMVPRSNGALGYVMPDRSERSQLLPTRADMLHDILISIAGRAAEVVRYGTENMTPGASSDLQNIEHIFRQMMTTGLLTDRITNYRMIQNLTDADTALLDDVRNEALLTASEVLKMVPDEKWEQLVDESLKSGTLIGKDAMDFYTRILGEDFDWEAMRALTRRFIGDPTGAHRKKGSQAA